MTPQDEYAAAADKLIFYMRRVWETAGMGWSNQNTLDMRRLVDHLMKAASGTATDAAADEIRAHVENDPHLYADGSSS